MRPSMLFAIAMIMIALNIGTVLKVPGGVELSRAAVLLALLYLSIIRGANFKVIITGFGALLLIAGLALASPYPDLSWTQVILSAVQVVMVYALLAPRYTRKDVRAVLFTIAVTPSLIVVCGYIYSLMGLWPWINRGSDGVARLQGSMVAAFLGSFAACGLVAAVQRASLEKSRLMVLLALVNCAILFSSGARGPAVVAIFLSTVYIFSTPNLSKRAKTGYATIGSFFVAAVFSVAGAPLLARLRQGGSSGRDELWDYYLQVARDYYYTGIGFNQTYFSTIPPELMAKVNTTAVHNDYIKLFAELGMPGLFTFYSLLCFAYIGACLSMYRRFPIVCVGPLLGFLGLSWIDNALSNISDVLLLVLGLFAAQPSTITANPRAISARASGKTAANSFDDESSSAASAQDQGQTMRAP